MLHKKKKLRKKSEEKIDINKRMVEKKKWLQLVDMLKHDTKKRMEKKIAKSCNNRRQNVL